jgi:hypothetical protein
MIVEHLAADLAAISCQQTIQLVPHRLCRLVSDVNVSNRDNKMVRCIRIQRGFECDLQYEAAIISENIVIIQIFE